MILGIGVDILEVGRMERALKQPGFKEKTFTQDEIAYCETKGAHSVESYAARFAAKEALGKALGTGILPGQLQQVEVLTDEKTGAPPAPSYGPAPGGGSHPSGGTGPCKSQPYGGKCHCPGTVGGIR